MLISLSYVVHLDETPLRVGGKRLKQHLLVACTRLYTYFFARDRSLATFKAFVLTELTGVIVHDRYINYDSAQLTDARAEARTGGTGSATVRRPLCRRRHNAHLLRDLAAMAEAYPDQTWPGQIADALRGLIHAANAARDAGRATMDAAIKAKLLNEFRHGVLVGPKDIPRTPGKGKQADFRPPHRQLHRHRSQTQDQHRRRPQRRAPRTTLDPKRGSSPARSPTSIQLQRYPFLIRCSLCWARA